MPRIVTRYEWKARSPKRLPAHVALSVRTATCTHHDGATPIILRTFEQACARVRTDQNYHMDGQGWNDIGYNFLVVSAPGVAGVDGLIFEGRGRDVIGAHCLNHNTEWIGIQVAIGGDQAPSAAALASVRWLHDSFEVAAGYRLLGKKVHSDGFATACPGLFLKTWVHSGMPVAHVAPVAPSRPPIARPTLLAVDGNFGITTHKRLQQWAHVTPDGVLGNNSWRHIQSRVHVTPTGTPDHNTWVHLQRLIGATQDGDFGPLSVKALQRYLNTH